MRAVALGRKNYLHFGSDSGGERGAAIYSLVASAKLNGLDPEAYLRQRHCSHPRTPSIASANCCCHGPWLSRSARTPPESNLLVKNADRRTVTYFQYLRVMRPLAHVFSEVLV